MTKLYSTIFFVEMFGRILVPVLEFLPGQPGLVYIWHLQDRESACSDLGPVVHTAGTFSCLKVLRHDKIYHHSAFDTQKRAPKIHWGTSTTCRITMIAKIGFKTKKDESESKLISTF